METNDGFAVEADGEVISVSGDLDAHTAPRLDDAISANDSGGSVRIVLDMSNVDFVDSSGLRSLIRARNVEGQERSVVLRSPSPATLRLLEITGMTEHFGIEDAP